MTKAAQRIADTMVNLVAEKGSGWEIVPSYVPTIRFTRERPTPDYALSEERGAWNALWSQPTYHTHVFVTLVNGKVILGTSAAPWVRRQDRDIPFWLAEAILEDPELALDDERVRAMREARKAARS